MEGIVVHDHGLREQGVTTLQRLLIVIECVRPEIRYVPVGLIALRNVSLPSDLNVGFRHRKNMYGFLDALQSIFPLQCVRLSDTFFQGGFAHH